jgi:hypothetical protein
MRALACAIPASSGSSAETSGLAPNPPETLAKATAHPTSGGTKETKRHPGAKPVPAVDRATADYQAPDLENASKSLLT